jgi:hypothetical protein
MEQLRACTVNAAAILLDDATKVDNQTHVPIIFKSDTDNCLCVPNQAFDFIISHLMSFSDILKRFHSPTCIHVCVLAQPLTNAPYLGLVSAQTPLPCNCLLMNMLAEVWSRCVFITFFLIDYLSPIVSGYGATQCSQHAIAMVSCNLH